MQRYLCGLVAGGLLAVLAGCGSGGGAAAPPVDGGGALTRGVPVELDLDSAQTLRTGGDDVVLVLAAADTGPTTAALRVNGGTSVLPQLSRARLGGERRDGAVDGLPPAGRQQVGDERTFAVLGGDEQAEATLQRVTEQTLLYVDDATPADAFAPGDLDDLIGVYDGQLTPLLHDLYGTPSDIDENGHVILLFTPTISPGRYGYFYAGDLSGSGGNRGEVLYVRVPRPGEGQSYAVVRTALLATLIHELQHLVNYRYKALDHGLGAEESWLNEALSFLSEDAAGYLDVLGGSTENVAEWQASPERFTMLERSGDYDDGHAGVGYLFVRWLVDHWGQGIVPVLLSSDLRGPANVAAAVGRPFDDLVLEFAAAALLDDSGVAAAGRYTIPGFDSRGRYPLTDIDLDGPRTTAVDAAGGAPAFTAQLPRGGLRYVRLTNVPSGGVTLSLSEPAGEVRVLAVRMPAES